LSLYEVHRLCHRAALDEQFRAQVRSAPERTLASMDLTPEETADLLAGAVGRLYRRGAHPVLLCRLAEQGLFGLDRAVYAQRIIDAGESPPQGSR
jgi:hypothetical protein